jgi:hypothetical protein
VIVNVLAGVVPDSVNEPQEFLASLLALEWAPQNIQLPGQAGRQQKNITGAAPDYCECP